MFCLPQFAIDKFIKSLPDTEEELKNLAEMSSEKRRAFFEESVGTENAKQVNALFESKLILKNQQRGLITFIKKVIGDTPLRKDFLAKVNDLKEILQPEDLDSFLADFAEKRLGVGVSVEEAGKLVDLAKRVEDYKTPYAAAIEKERANIKGKMSPEDAQNEGKVGRALDKLADDKTSSLYEHSIAYGLRLEEFNHYVENLKTEAGTLKMKDYLRNPLRIARPILDVTKSLWSTLDNSFQLRQAVPLLLTGRFGTWAKGFTISWKMIGEQFVSPKKGGLFSEQEEVAIRGLKARILARPMAIDGTFTRMKVAIGISGEEAYPTSVLNRIPLLGRVFSASESAYNGTALELRYRLAEKFGRDAQEQGINLKDKDEAQSLGKVVNSLTGRGNINLSEETSGFVNSALFSLRYVKSQYDILTAHTGGAGLKSSFARKQAAYNVVKLYGSVIVLNLVANALFPGSVDPRKHLGKIRIANHWVNYAGGMTSIAQTAENIGFFLYNQSQTNKLPKYGSQTGMDMFWGFWEGKTAPMFSVMRDYMKGRTYQGKKPTLLGEASQLPQPLGVQNFEQLYPQTNFGELLLLQALDTLGASVTANPPKK